MNVVTIDMKRFTGITEKLYTDYESVRSFYPYDYTQTGHWHDRIGWLDRHPGADREKVCTALKAVNARLGAGAATLHNIEKLSDVQCLTVVTGQQTGLFTGPLYTLYKAVTVIKQAKALSEETGRAVVPVFWMATEDHDFAEIAMNWHFNGTRVKRIRLSRKHQGNVPVGSLPVTAELTRLCREVCEDLGLEANGAEMTTLLSQTLAESATVGDWFGRLLLALFAPWGLVVLDPAESAMRSVMKPFFKHALDHAQRIQKAFQDSTEAVVSQGFHPEVVMDEGQTGLFVIEAGERLPLFTSSGGSDFTDRKGQLLWSLPALLDRVETNPAEFSTGVVLRPVLQDWLLPVAAAVLGPSEAAYHGQLGGVFTAFGRQLPVIVPRESWVLAPDLGSVQLHEIQRLLNGNPEQWIADQLMDRADSGLRQRVDRYQKETAESFRALAETLPVSDPAQQTIIDHALGVQERQIRWMMRMIRSELSSAPHEETIRLLARIIRPLGKAQERVLLPWYFLSQRGLTLLTELVDLPFSAETRLHSGGMVR